MKVTHVSLLPARAATEAGRPALTPELLAATGARYSRNNEGLESILAKIDPADPDRSVDSIFRMIDYGHQSIADMAPVAMFLDGVSLWLAYYVWSVCPVAGGQESSTRYLPLSVEGLLAPASLGMEGDAAFLWQEAMTRSFAAYHEALAYWTALSVQEPDVMALPREVLEDSSEGGEKRRARMRRNYAFDRARYFLPVAAATNMMLVMPSRGWVQLCQSLFSHALPEPRRLAEAIRAELALVTPRLVKHAEGKGSFVSGQAAEFERLASKAWADGPSDYLAEGGAARATPFLTVYGPEWGASFEEALAFHDNRYAWMGEGLRRTAVRFGWDAVAFAEIRDLNRHRTGTKHCPLLPVGFYGARDQVPVGRFAERLRELCRVGREISKAAHARLSRNDPRYVYWTLLGTQYRFEHLTTADKMIYEAELRTGPGAHFRYAEHFHDLLRAWYARFPATRGLILEGSAEPE